MAYIDTSKVTIPKGFFEDLNVPKLLDWLNSQPTADVVEVKHGEWVGGKFNDYSGEYEEQCSNCKKYSREYARPYCPNCGANMRGDK